MSVGDRAQRRRRGLRGQGRLTWRPSAASPPVGATTGGKRDITAVIEREHDRFRRQCDALDGLSDASELQQGLGGAGPNDTADVDAARAGADIRGDRAGRALTTCPDRSSTSRRPPRRR
jgi:hypothetical protein